MAGFSGKALKEISAEHDSISQKHQNLVFAYLGRTYQNERAREFATNGFLRRLKTLTRCVDNVFSILPPERTALPGSDELSDAVINLQAFVFNVFGSLDNLAWIWTYEGDLRDAEGQPLAAGAVGLSRKCRVVRKSLSVGLQKYLKGIDPWLAYQSNYRHALAHRIPLYIPPHTIPKSKEAAYLGLEARMTKAMKQQRFSEYDRLAAKQELMASFTPMATHSFGEKARAIYFHPQMLADFNTVVEIGMKMHDELKSLG